MRSRSGIAKSLRPRVDRLQLACLKAIAATARRGEQRESPRHGVSRGAGTAPGASRWSLFVGAVDCSAGAPVATSLTPPAGDDETPTSVRVLSPWPERSTSVPVPVGFGASLLSPSSTSARRDTPIARQVLDRLLTDRICWTPRRDEGIYEYRGRLHYNRLLAGIYRPKSAANRRAPLRKVVSPQAELYARGHGKSLEK